MKTRVLAVYSAKWGRDHFRVEYYEEPKTEVGISGRMVSHAGWWICAAETPDKDEAIAMARSMASSGLIDEKRIICMFEVSS